MFIRFAHFRLIALVLHRAGDVTRRSIAEECGHRELLPGTRLRDDVAGKNRDPLDGRFRFGVIGEAGFDPTPNRAVILGVAFETGAAFVGNLATGFQQNQAVIRCGRVGPASARLPRDHLKVGSRIEPEERKLKPVLAGRLGVAGPGVAMAAGENGHDVVGEADRLGLVKLFDANLDRGGGMPV